jgi:hypothetical protein
VYYCGFLNAQGVPAACGDFYTGWEKALGVKQVWHLVRLDGHTTMLSTRSPGSNMARCTKWTVRLPSTKAKRRSGVLIF